MAQYTLTDNEKNILRLTAKGLDEKTVDKHWMPLYAYGKLELIHGVNSEISLLIASQVLQKPELVNLAKQGFLVQEPGQSDNYILMGAKILEAVRTDFGGLTQGKPVSIFISYSHKDDAITHDLARLLRKTYEKVWYDPDLPAGNDWKGRLKKQIEECTVFLLVLSRNWLDSPHCYDEFDMATAQKKFIIPFQIEVGLKIPAPLSNIQAVVNGDAITVDGLNALYSTLIQNFHSGTPAPRYVLTENAKEWARKLDSWWREEKIEQMFTVLDTGTFGNPTDVSYGIGVCDHDILTNQVINPSTLHELEAAGLVKLVQFEKGGSNRNWQATLLQHLREAVAANFK